MAKLGECFSVIRNGASIRQTDGAGGFPITRIETIADKTINKEKFGYAGIYDLAQYRDYILQDGDILMSHINSEKHLGKVALYSKQDDEQIIHGMNLLMLRADTQKMIPEYAKYFFESQKFLRQIGRITKKSVNQASFTVTALKELEIPLASIIVQRDISEKLKKVDWLVSLRKQQLAKLDELVKARFVEMFGDINVNNKKWMTYPLGELCTIVRGGSPRPIEKYLGGSIPWIKIGDATTGENIYLNSTKEYIIQEGVKKSRMIKAGSLIFANCGVSLGFARIITFDGCIHDGWLAMEDIDEKLDKIFLLYSLNQMTEYFRKTAPAGTQPNLNTNIMKMHRQIVPPMEMQKAFISFVRYIDNQKQLVQQSLEKLELMKKALMQEYFG